jgi:hypothetical protein
MNLNKLIKDSLIFNEISGSDKEVSLLDIERQIKFTLDEAKELRDSLNHYYLTGQNEGEIVKEALDVIVCAVGVLQKMQTLGYDITECSNIVGENNLSKYPKTQEEALKSLQDLASKGVNAYVSYNPEYNAYVIRDTQEGKVRKPSGYQKVDSDSFKKG